MRPEEWNPEGVADIEPRAWQALRETTRSVLVTASAGAGKTEFLAQKAAYLLQTGLCQAPQRILAMSFKRDAAYNLAERVSKRCASAQARRFNSYTFDAFSKRIVDKFRGAIKERYRPPREYRIVLPSRFDYQDFLDLHAIGGINSQQLESAIATIRLPIENTETELSYAVDRYWRSMYERNGDFQLSFMMLNRLAEYLLRTNRAILQALRVTYPVVFIDEYQDTTAAQFQLLLTAFHRSRTVFTAVGDDKQRIMLWAGAMPDAFGMFEQRFRAARISLVCNWRSHIDLVRIQYAIARRIDPGVEESIARAERDVQGSVAAIWQIANQELESDCIASWIEREISQGNVKPSDIGILVRMHANDVEERLSPAFENRGLRLRNEARVVGDIAIQELLAEDLTQTLLRLLRLGSVDRSPTNWSAAERDLHFIEGIDPSNEISLAEQQRRLQSFVREMRDTLRRLPVHPSSAEESSRAALNFIGIDAIQRAFPQYKRRSDLQRVRDGFVLLLKEALDRAETWSLALDEFEGLDQTSLMTIHKSKGLEFHTMIFYGLDNRTWWSLTPNRVEELNSFFVAFTRAKQRAYFTLCLERGGPVQWIESLLAPAGVRRFEMSLNE